MDRHTETQKKEKKSSHKSHVHKSSHKSKHTNDESRTVNKIKREREEALLKNEVKEFEEINKLLQGSVSDEDESFVSPMDVNEDSGGEVSVIPLEAPGTVIFNEENIFSLFNEHTLQLKDFLKKKNCFVFGRDIIGKSEECFRNLILQRVAENELPDESKFHYVSLYVFYLLSVHSDQNFVNACFDFLKIHRFLISANEILPVLINFGSNVETLTGTTDEVELPFQCQNESNFETGKYSFPIHNMEMVGQLLIFYVNRNLVRIESNIKGLIQALIKITLDPKVRFSCLLPIYSTLVSILSSKASEYFGLFEVTDWLHLNNEHLLNQVEVCRIVFNQASFELYQSLYIKTIKTILENWSLGESWSPPIQIKEIKHILRESKIKSLDILELYCVLQLVISTLPSVTATVKDSNDINHILTSLERKIVTTKDHTDKIRLKLDVAKLRTAVAIKIDHRFAEKIVISPVKKPQCSN